MGGVRRYGAGVRRYGVPLGAVIAIILGASGGTLFARLSSAESAERAPTALANAAPLVIPARPTITPATETAATRAATRRASRSRLDARCGRPGARVIRYRVVIDGSLPTTARQFAAGVRAVLCDRRGWIDGGDVAFRYDPKARTVIALRTPEHTERACLRLTGLSVRKKYSCASSGARLAVLNSARWFGGSPTWDGSVADYRRLMVNHEVGHLLGLGHRACRSGRAPVMMQQSKGLNGCRPNPWPLPSELRAL